MAAAACASATELHDPLILLAQAMLCDCVLCTCWVPSGLQEVAHKLTQLAVKRGSQDNIGVVLVDLGKVDWSQASGGGGLFGSLFGSR